MKIAMFSYQPYESDFLQQANHKTQYDFQCHTEHLDINSVHLAKNCDAVCCFVNDTIDEKVIVQLKTMGVKLIALRSAGFNHVDLSAAKSHQIAVAHVPAYSPHAVAEFTVALILSLNRKLRQSYMKIHQQNFLLDGLLGFDLHAKTVGIIGTGNIGSVVCDIMRGFGCHVLAYDPKPNSYCEQQGVSYLSLAALYEKSDIISLHCPLNKETQHLINADSIKQTKSGVMLINTSRGGLIDSQTIIPALKSGQIGYLGLDVYEEEEALFFQDLSNKIIQDDIYTRLETFPNVLLTAHQAFFTQEAVNNIFQATVENISAFFFQDHPINIIHESHN